MQAVKQLVSAPGSFAWRNRNWIIPYGKSFLEARYVKRTATSVSTYVSSHNGCKMACKFCWLTKQKQTSFLHTTLDGYDAQMRTIMDGIPDDDFRGVDKRAVKVNVNFMARGEAMANKTMLNEYARLYASLDGIVRARGFKGVKMNVSTIMPHAVAARHLIDVFGDAPVHIYYSLYSTNEAFRKTWLPNAMPFGPALDKLAAFQQARLARTPHDVPTVVFHWAFIKGQNDSPAEIQNVLREIRARPFVNTKFNLVRYNPFDATSEEPSDAALHALFAAMNGGMTNTSIAQNSRIIPRADAAVFASCGQFIRDEEV